MKILGWQSWVFAGFIFVLGLFFESMLAKQTWNWVQKSKKRHGGLVGVVCALAILTSQSIHAWADASYYVPVTGLGQVLPVYKGVTAKSFLTRTGLVDVKESRERALARRMSQSLEASSDRLLNYPLNPLACEQNKQLNLLLIVVDSMRGSMSDAGVCAPYECVCCNAGNGFPQPLQRRKFFAHGHVQPALWPAAGILEQFCRAAAFTCTHR